MLSVLYHAWYRLRSAQELNEEREAADCFRAGTLWSLSFFSFSLGCRARGRVMYEKMKKIRNR